MLEKTLKLVSPCFSLYYEYVNYLKCLLQALVIGEGRGDQKWRKGIDCHWCRQKEGWGKGDVGINSVPSFCEYQQLRDTHFLFHNNSLYQKSFGLHTHNQ